MSEVGAAAHARSLSLAVSDLIASLGEYSEPLTQSCAGHVCVPYLQCNQKLLNMSHGHFFFSDNRPQAESFISAESFKRTMRRLRGLQASRAPQPSPIRRRSRCSCDARDGANGGIDACCVRSDNSAGAADNSSAARSTRALRAHSRCAAARQHE